MQNWLKLLPLIFLISSGAARSDQVFITYYHNDLLGSPVAATDESGKILWREHFRPYGERQDAPYYFGYGSLGFTGHAHGQFSGLAYMGARYYDPVIGRFLSVDPVGAKSDAPDSLSRYAYSSNNPFRYIDPDGREIVSVNSADNRRIESMINSISFGRFMFSKNNRLQIVPGSGGKFGSAYYSQRLISGIASAGVISISLGGVVALPGGRQESVSDYFGGGVTVGPIKGGEQRVTVSENGTAVEAAGGGYIPYSQSESLMHELVGHAIPRLVGGGSGDGVVNENKVRVQLPGVLLRVPGLMRDTE
ncbi:RHS domain-containing protein [Pseudomonas sp. PDNC002]|uniref:RHS repeat domain-containing protein n=1 Tax=Pseudomonas sp. PDNC002 TaxID=2811422 RepID=UPI0019634D56|nr:RHS repeat-associated core domain-containing protein [Pseudomonas sp. PDNC002]QRY80304.1 RHS domain-containing protein [Pseudomonas sp. PDNC002]